MPDAEPREEVPEERLLDLIRTALPRLLREHPEFRHEVAGILAEAFPTRQEFAELLEEIRALRADFLRFAEETARRFEAIERRFEAMDRRFEAVDRRFEAVDRRFEAVDRRFEELIREMRGVRLEVSALSGRLGYGLERIVQGVIEEFAGEQFTRAERLVLTDTTGEVYGVAGAQVEYDLVVSDGTAYVVEVKSHLKPDDVLTFHRKAAFAARRLGRPLKKLMIAASMEERVEPLLRQLEIDFIVRSRLP
ncbi:MAG TPA: hypothetical protein VNP04_27190 [Alphaproteobacteria bacterium]|nr:hypothetical protein [Alphaproteobacteria bacterium]